MAQYFEDFSSKTLGVQPIGWTARFDTTSQFTVEAEGIDGHALRYTATANNRYLLSWDVLDTDANRNNIEFVGRFKYTNTLGIGSLGLFAGRGSGTSTTETCYRCAIYNDGTSVMSLNKYVSGTGTTLSTTPMVFATNTWYRARFRVNGTSLYLKIWLDSIEEPVTWNINGYVDSSISGVGWGGAFSFDSAADPLYWDWIGVGTNGETAPMVAGGTTIVCSAGVGSATSYIASISNNVLITANTAIVSATGYFSSLQSVNNISCSVGNASATSYHANISSPVELLLNASASSALGQICSVSSYINVAFDDNFERSNINITESNIVQDVYAPTITIYPRLQTSETSGGLPKYWVFNTKITGANGKQPNFQIRIWESSGGTRLLNILAYTTQRFKYSYDQVTWYDFDTMSANADGMHYDFKSNTAFTSDVVYIATTRTLTVSDTTNWITNLASTYPSYVSMPTSSAGNNYIFNTMGVQTDELGRSIPSLPLHSLEITDPTQQPDDGSAKRVAVMFSGIHSAEDHGGWVLKEAVNFLLGTDPKAIAARKNFRFYIYPLVNPSGRYGGHWRGDFNSVNPLYDTNRHWLATPNIECITKTIAAVLLDIGNQPVSISYDFHGGDAGYFSYSGATLYDAWLNKMKVYYPSMFTMGSNNLYCNTYWSINTLKAPLSATVEIGVSYPISDAVVADYGATTIKTISELFAENVFPVQIIAPTAIVSASSGVANLGVGINCMSAVLDASGFVSNIPEAGVITCLYANVVASCFPSMVASNDNIFCNITTVISTSGSANISIDADIICTSATVVSDSYQSTISANSVIQCGSALVTAILYSASVSSGEFILSELGNSTAFGNLVTLEIIQNVVCSSAIAAASANHVYFYTDINILCSNTYSTAYGYNAPINALQILSIHNVSSIFTKTKNCDTSFTINRNKYIDF